MADFVAGVGDFMGAEEDFMAGADSPAVASMAAEDSLAEAAAFTAADSRVGDFIRLPPRDPRCRKAPPSTVPAETSEAAAGSFETPTSCIVLSQEDRD